MNLTLYNPANIIRKFWDDGSFPDFFRTSIDDDIVDFFPTIRIPMADVKETEKEYKINLEMPGLEKDDIKVELKDSVLTVKGERKYEKEDRNEDAKIKEKGYSSFIRSFTLSNDVNENDIKASYKNGLLKLSIPKKEETKTKKIEVKIS